MKTKASILLVLAALFDSFGVAQWNKFIAEMEPSGNDKFFADGQGNNRLGVAFKDVSYKLPSGATDLVVRFEAMSTFFTIGA